MNKPVRTSTKSKHEAVYTYFHKLFEIKRLRYDDAIEDTASHFYYSTSTVEDILRLQRNKLK